MSTANLPQAKAVMAFDNPAGDVAAPANRVLKFSAHGGVITHRNDGQKGYRFFADNGKGSEADFVATYSDEINFLDSIESWYRRHGCEFHYPTQGDHVWLKGELPLPEGWKFFWDDSSGCVLHREKFYAFSDAGGVESHTGHATAAECAEFLVKEGLVEKLDEIGTEPNDLGEYSVVVLSAERYVARLNEIDPYTEDWVYGEFCDSADYKPEGGLAGGHGA